MAQTKKTIESVITQTVRKAGADGLRISEIVKLTRRTRRDVARTLQALRHARVLKLRGERRTARWHYAKK